MTTILISTIGARDYDQTIYEFEDGRMLETSQFTYALAQYVRPDTLFALLTEDARILQWEAKNLKGQLETVPGLRIVEVPIPKGQNEGELWEIFDEIAKSIPSDSEIVLDITHGFRFSPMVSLTAVNYLRNAKDVRIKDIYYGAFDAVPRDVSPKPVFRFGPFITLLDWANAVESFVRTGECAQLARLLDDTQAIRYRSRTESDSQPLPTRLKSVARQLRRLSLALDLLRPDEIMSAAAQLVIELKQAESEFPTWAKPFNLLLERIIAEFNPIALTNPRADENLDANLACQWSLIRWYLGHERYAAALLLAREWALSWYMRHSGADASAVYNQDGERDAAEHKLRDLWKTDQFGSKALEDLVKVWRNLVDQRNDLAHTGMRVQAIDADRLRQNIVQQIKALAEVTSNTL